MCLKFCEIIMLSVAYLKNNHNRRRGILQVMADLVSLYVVAITVCLAAFAGFQSFSYMLDVADIFPGEHGIVPPLHSSSNYMYFASVAIVRELFR